MDAKAKVLELVMKNGIFAVLFVGLLLFVINDSKDREQKYQQTISMLSQSIHTDIKESQKKIDEILKVVLKR